MALTNAHQVSLILGALAGAPGGIADGPELALDKVFERGHRHSRAEEFGLNRSTREVAIASIKSDLETQTAAGEERIDRIWKLLHLEARLPQCLGNPLANRYGKIGIQRDDGFNIVIDGQAPN